VDVRDEFGVLPDPDGCAPTRKAGVKGEAGVNAFG